MKTNPFRSRLQARRTNQKNAAVNGKTDAAGAAILCACCGPAATLAVEKEATHVTFCQRGCTRAVSAQLGNGLRRGYLRASGGGADVVQPVTVRRSAVERAGRPSRRYGPEVLGVRHDRADDRVDADQPDRGTPCVRSASHLAARRRCG